MFEKRSLFVVSLLLVAVLSSSVFASSVIFDNGGVSHEEDLKFNFKGETYDFNPVNGNNKKFTVNDLGAGFYKFSINFTLPNANFKLTIPFGEVVEQVNATYYVYDSNLFVDFQDVIDSGLTLEFTDEFDAVQIGGFDENKVGQEVEVDPIVGDTTGTTFLRAGNQRKFFTNPADGSWWVSFVGNSSCFLGSSYDNGTSWNFTNTSAGSVDYGCSLEIDSGGNMFAYWTNATPGGTGSLFVRVFGWNGTGWDMKAPLAVTDTGAVYGTDFSLKACGDTIGLMYQNPSAVAPITCFKACRSYSAGGCNATVSNWNSTNQTLGSYCSIDGAFSASEYSLECNGDDFYAGYTANAPASNYRLAYGESQGTGNYLFNSITLWSSAPLSSSAVVLTNTTDLLAFGLKTYTSNEVVYSYCPSSSDCNATANWTTEALLSANDGAVSGEIALSAGFIDNSSDMAVIWSKSGGVEGRLYTTDWSTITEFIPGSENNRDANLMRNTSVNNVTFIYANLNDNTVRLLTENQTDFLSSNATVSTTTCPAGYYTAINFSFADANEPDVKILHDTDDTFNVWDITRSVNETINLSETDIGHFLLCLKPDTETFLVDSFQVYSDDDYNNMAYFLYNASVDNTSVNNITLYTANDTTTKATKITVKDVNGLLLQGTYVSSLRYYPGLDAYYNVGMVRTDNQGEGLTYLTPNDVWYRFSVFRPSTGATTFFDARQVICDPILTECDVLLQFTETQLGESDYYSYVNGIESECYFVSASNTSVCTVADSSGLFHNYTLNVYDEAGNLDCTDSSLASVTTLSCIVTGGDGAYNSYLVATGSPEFILNSADFRIGSFTTVFATVGLFLALLIVVSISFVAGFSPSSAVLFGALGVVAVSVFGFILLSTTEIVALIIVALIIAWKVKK